MEHSILERRKRKKQHCYFWWTSRPVNVKGYELWSPVQFRVPVYKASYRENVKHFCGSHLNFKWLSRFNAAFLLCFTKAGSLQIEAWLISVPRRKLLIRNSSWAHWNVRSVYWIAPALSLEWRLLIVRITWTTICLFFSLAPRNPLLCQESRVEGNSTQQRNGPLPAVSASSEGSKNLWDPLAFWVGNSFFFPPTHLSSFPFSSSLLQLLCYVIKILTDTLLFPWGIKVY